MEGSISHLTLFRFLKLTIPLGHIDYLDEAIEHLNSEIEERVKDEEQHIEHLDAIPGVNRRIAQITLAELGTDMSKFPSATHLASWAGLCPGNDESGGKRYSGKTRKGNQALRRALIEAAHAAGMSKNTYLGALYRRLAGRIGRKKAALAVAHRILVIIYHLLAGEEEYKDFGATYFDERAREMVEKRLVRRLEGMGYQVILQKAS